MAILTQEQYYKKPEETTEQYNARIKALSQMGETGYANLTSSQKGSLYPSAVLSGSNIEENVRPQLDADLKKISGKGNYTDNDGITRVSTGEPIEEKTDNDKFLENLAAFNKKFGRQPTDSTGIKKTTGGGLDTTGAFDEAGNAIGGTRKPSAADQETEDYYSEVRSLIDSMKTTLDARTKRYLDSIESKYSVLKARREQINKAAEASVAQSLLMGSSSRYAQISSAGIERQRNTASLRAIAELEAQEQSLINEALTAQENGDYKLLESTLELTKQKREEKVAAVKKVDEELKKQSDELKKVERESQIGDAVYNIFAGGVINTPDIYAKLRNQGISATPKEVDDIAKIFTIKEENEKDLKNDYGLFSYFKENNKLPENVVKMPENEQYLGWLNIQKMANSGKLSEAANLAGGGKGVIPGKGAKNAIEEQLIRDRMFIQFQPLFNKGVLSESDRKIIEEKIANYRNAGMSEGKILSIFAGFPPDVKTPYNQKMTEIVIATTPNADKHRELMNKIGVLLKNNNPTTAMRVIENNAIEKALEQKVINKDSFMSEDDVSYIKNKVNDIDKLLGEGWNNEVGAFTGSFSKWLSDKFGWGQAAKIKAKLGSLTADMIKKRAGSAMTETEWEKLIKPNIPQFNEAANTWTSKLQELQDNSLERYNSGRAVAILPAITMDQLNIEKRLSLYQTIQSQSDDFWSGDNYQITNESGEYEIPVK